MLELIKAKIKNLKTSANLELFIKYLKRKKKNEK